MGLASRGLFAEELFDLDHWMVAFKVMGVTHKPLRDVQAAAAQMILATAAIDGDDIDEAKRLSTAAADQLAPLIVPATFKTTVQNGAPLLKLARFVGRKKNPTATQPNPPQPTTGCSKVVDDGGAVALLHTLVSDIEDGDDRMAVAELRSAATCISRELAEQVEAIETHSFGKDGGFCLKGLTPVSMANAFVANYEHLFSQQREAGWLWSDEHTASEFNEATQLLLKRVRAVVQEFKEAVAHASPQDATRAVLVEMSKVAVRTCRFSSWNCGSNPAGSRRSWLSDSSVVRTGAWAADDGFGPIQHSCIFFGDKSTCSYWPDVLHYVLLRSYGADWARELLLAKSLAKPPCSQWYSMPFKEGYDSPYAAIKGRLATNGLPVSSRGGSEHMAQFHGHRASRALSLSMVDLLPEPYATARYTKQILWRFLVRVTVEVTNPAEHFGLTCVALSKLVTASVSLLDLTNSNVTPPLTTKRGNTWSWTTSPSGYLMATFLSQHFEERCAAEGGFAGRSAAGPEQAHKVVRRANAHSFMMAAVKMGEHSTWYHILMNVLGAKLSFVSNQRRFTSAIRRTVRRHKREQATDHALLRELMVLLDEGAACIASFEACPQQFAEFRSVLLDKFRTEDRNCWVKALDKQVTGTEDEVDAEATEDEAAGGDAPDGEAEGDNAADGGEEEAGEEEEDCNGDEGGDAVEGSGGGGVDGGGGSEVHGEDVADETLSAAARKLAEYDGDVDRATARQGAQFLSVKELKALVRDQGYEESLSNKKKAWLVAKYKALIDAGEERLEREAEVADIIARDAETAWRDEMEGEGEGEEEGGVEDAQDELWQQGSAFGEVVPEMTEYAGTLELDEIEMDEHEVED